MNFVYILTVLFFFLATGVKIINQYERGLILTLGKYTNTLQPGFRIIIPIIQKIIKVDIRTKTVDVPDQEVITKDNISVSVNAVVYYKIINSEKAILEIENFYYAISQLSQTTMRNAIGDRTLDDLLGKRKEIAEQIKTELDQKTDKWGIDVESLELKDVSIPEDLKRVISKAAEAEREKKAVIIKAEGDKIASENLVYAAKKLGETPGAMHLRTLQAINDMASDKSNTTIWMLPVEILEALKGLNKS